MPREPEKPSDKQVASRWKKGQSGNPAGRPKGATLTEMLREYGEREFLMEGEALQVKEHLARAVHTAILMGYRLVEGKKVELSDIAWVNCLKWLYDRVDGKPTENLHIRTPEIEASSEAYEEAMKQLAEWKEHRESSD